MFSLEELFCSVDDFCARFEPGWKQQLIGQGKSRCRSRRLSLSEIMTIEIAFHASGYKNFQTFYLELVSLYWQEAFPDLVSYNRFIEWQPSTLIPLMAYLRSRLGTSRIGFIDSTSIKVCHNRRIKQHRVFKAIAKRGKTSVDWFYGFKLHLAQRIRYVAFWERILLPKSRLADRRASARLERIRVRIIKGNY